MHRNTLAAVGTILLSVATGGVAWSAPGDDIAPEARQEAETVWQSRCSTCHGAAGKGDGAAAAALTPKPRDFSQQSWQSSVTDEHIEKIIAEGGQSVGLSMLMPANPDLVAKPDVIKALRAHVRSLGGK
jgi:mono/diheme cytochrome c family protein